MAVCRAITAFFISPAAAIGSGVVKETFFKKDRAKYMGIWTLMVTLGVPTAPFIFGFVAYRVDYRWIYWTLAMTNGVQLILYFFLGPETRYIRKGVSHEGSDFKQEYVYIWRRIDPTPMTFMEFLRPLTFFFKLTVFLPTFAYAMVFNLAYVLTSVEIPQLYGPKFGLNTQQLGLQYLGFIIGAVIGEQIGGISSDRWMSRRTKKQGGVRPAPEYRLWLSYGGYVLSIVGVIVFLVETGNATPMHWQVSPTVGAGIAAAGTQIVTTVVVTYCVDCYVEDAAAVGVFITFVRQIWGFIGPFWYVIRCLILPVYLSQRLLLVVFICSKIGTFTFADLYPLPSQVSTDVRELRIEYQCCDMHCSDSWLQFCAHSICAVERRVTEEESHRVMAFIAWTVKC